jgi:trimeric autotransporter adhesin
MAVEVRLTCSADKLGTPEQLLRGLGVLHHEVVCTQICNTGSKSSNMRLAVPMQQGRALLKKYSGWCPYSHAGAMCSIKAVAVTEPHAFSIIRTSSATAAQQPASSAAGASEAKHSNSSNSTHLLLNSLDELSSAKDDANDDDTLCDIGRLYTAFLRASSYECETSASRQSIGIGYRLSNTSYPAAGCKSGQPHLEQEQQQFVRQQRERVLMRSQQSTAQAKRSARSHDRSSSGARAKAGRSNNDSSDSEPEHYSSSKQHQRTDGKYRLNSSSREQHTPLVAEAKSSGSDAAAYSKGSQDDAVFSCEHWPESPRIAAFTAKLAEQRQELALASLSEVALALQQLQRRMHSHSSSSSTTNNCEPSLTQLRAVLKQLYSSGAVFAHNPPGVAHTLDMLGLTRHVAAPWQQSATTFSSSSNSSSSRILLWRKLLRRAVGHVRRFLSFAEFLLLARSTVLQSQLQQPKQQREAKGWGSAELARLDAAIDDELTALAAAQQQRQQQRHNSADNSSAAASAQDSADAAALSWLCDNSTTTSSSSVGAVRAAFAAHAVPGTASAAPVVHISGAVAALWQLGWSLPQEAVWRWRVTSATDTCSATTAGATHDSEYLDWASFKAMCTALRAGMQQLPECADENIDWHAMTQQLQRLQPAAVTAISTASDTAIGSASTTAAAHAVAQLPKRRESAHERERREKLCAAAAKRADPVAVTSKHSSTTTATAAGVDLTAAVTRESSAVVASAAAVVADSRSTAAALTLVKAELQPDVAAAVMPSVEQQQQPQTSSIDSRTAADIAGVVTDAAVVGSGTALSEVKAAQHSVSTTKADNVVEPAATAAAAAAESSGATAAASGDAASADKHVTITP